MNAKTLITDINNRYLDSNTKEEVRILVFNNYYHTSSMN